MNPKPKRSTRNVEPVETDEIRKSLNRIHKVDSGAWQRALFHSVMMSNVRYHLSHDQKAALRQGLQIP